MVTCKLFWQNPYLTELDSYVKSVNGNQITVKETIFYAFAGGQESDQGSIGGFPVIEAKLIGKEIFYTLPENHDLHLADPVKICINWERRYRLMRLHFAAEVVLEIVYKQFPGIQKIGAHIAQDKARIDFASEHNFMFYIADLQKQAQQIVDSDQPIISAFSDEANERRYWKIKEFAQVACGGTHVKRTSEIGRLLLKRVNPGSRLLLKRVNPGKGKQRLEIYLVDV